MTELHMKHSRQNFWPESLGQLIGELQSLSFEAKQEIIKHLGAKRNDQSHARGLTGDVTVSSLTQREKQVLILLANGYSRREISAALFISLNTAARHVSNIYRKIDANNIADATRYAIVAGLTG